MTPEPRRLLGTTGNVAGFVLLPFVVQFALMVLYDLGLTAPYPIVLAAGITTGLYFLKRATGQAVWILGVGYVPIMAFLLIMFTLVWACNTGRGCI